MRLRGLVGVAVVLVMILGSVLQPVQGASTMIQGAIFCAENEDCAVTFPTSGATVLFGYFQLYRIADPAANGNPGTEIQLFAEKGTTLQDMCSAGNPTSPVCFSDLVTPGAAATGGYWVWRNSSDLHKVGNYTVNIVTKSNTPTANTTVDTISFIIRITNKVALPADVQTESCVSHTCSVNLTAGAWQFQNNSMLWDIYGNSGQTIAAGTYCSGAIACKPVNDNVIDQDVATRARVNATDCIDNTCLVNLTAGAWEYANRTIKWDIYGNAAATIGAGIYCTTGTCQAVNDNVIDQGIATRTLINQTNCVGNHCTDYLASLINATASSGCTQNCTMNATQLKSMGINLSDVIVGDITVARALVLMVWLVLLVWCAREEWWLPAAIAFGGFWLTMFTNGFDNRHKGLLMAWVLCLVITWAAAAWQTRNAKNSGNTGS